MEDSEGDVGFTDPSCENDFPDVEEPEGDSWVAAFPTLFRALIATVDDFAVCGRDGTELGVFFKLFERGVAELS